MEISVLIVDDDHDFGRAAAELLADRGYRVLGQATTAAEALARCDQLDPDAVLLDVGLPDGDGVTLAQKLKRAHIGRGSCSPQAIAKPFRQNASVSAEPVGSSQRHSSCDATSTAS